MRITLFAIALASLSGACSPPMKENVRVNAANQFACDAGQVSVQLVAAEKPGPNAPPLSPDTKTYRARGCGKAATYVCSFAQSKCTKTAD